MEWLVKTFLGATIGPLLDKGADIWKAKITQEGSLDEHTTQMTIETLKASVAERQYQTALLVAEQGNWVTRWVRPAWSAPFIFYTGKVIVWDMALGWGSTPPLGDQMAQLMFIVAGAYFGGRTIEKVAATIAGRKK